ncbi:rCG28885 [Rattus norvegicus]|uniref:RCG28885 n=1 Tax=Rattus norvegicus TaxID=10116 RepID=A6HWK6_RAT|nr:rCG28885 [Rattus norvegicus]
MSMDRRRAQCRRNYPCVNRRLA